jgi:hypothetical protein
MEAEVPDSWPGGEVRELLRRFSVGFSDSGVGFHHTASNTLILYGAWSFSP